LIRAKTSVATANPVNKGAKVMKEHIGFMYAGVAGVALGAATPATAAKPEPFKQTNIHFETNASACDMGIQMSFDTDGISELSVKEPNGTRAFDAQSYGV